MLGINFLAGLNQKRSLHSTAARVVNDTEKFVTFRVKCPMQIRNICNQNETLTILFVTCYIRASNNCVWVV